MGGTWESKGLQRCLLDTYCMFRKRMGVPLAYAALGAEMSIQYSCKVLLPVEKKRRRMFVLSSIVAAMCEVGHESVNF